MKRRLLLTCVGALVLLSLLAMAWAAMAPLTPGGEQVFEIPQGTWARRMKGEQATILPDHIRLVLGVRDVLLLRNRDDVPQVFGPMLIMPGQDFRLPFAQAGEHPFECTAHASGQMTVLVDEAPAAGWQRLQWRIKSILKQSE